MIEDSSSRLHYPSARFCWVFVAGQRRTRCSSAEPGDCPDRHPRLSSLNRDVEVQSQGKSKERNDPFSASHIPPSIARESWMEQHRLGWIDGEQTWLLFLRILIRLTVAERRWFSCSFSSWESARSISNCSIRLRIAATYEKYHDASSLISNEHLFHELVTYSGGSLLWPRSLHRFSSVVWVWIMKEWVRRTKFRVGCFLEWHSWKRETFRWWKRSFCH